MNQNKTYNIENKKKFRCCNQGLLVSTCIAFSEEGVKKSNWTLSKKYFQSSEHPLAVEGSSSIQKNSQIVTC